MTITEIKRALPNVNVSFNGAPTLGRVCGRLERFATVYVPERANVSFRFAWSVIQRAVNTGITLRL